MRVRVMILLALLGSLSAACSVVGDGKVNPVSPPFGLDDTVVSSTEAPSTTALATTTIVPEPSTTIIPTEPVRQYYISGAQLLFVTTPLPAGAGLTQIMAALQAGPEPLGALAVGLRSAVPGPQDGDIIVTDNRAGIALVTLPANFFDKVPVTDQRLATAQIVLTLTDSRGIGQVQFDQAVPKPSGALAAAGKPLTHADYASMLNAPSSSTSTSSTSSTGP